MKSSPEIKIKRRIFISTGEVSGDWHGAILIEALHERAALKGIELEIVGLGGDRMAAAGEVTRKYCGYWLDRGC
jgi:lipid-A-disaccharide synthase